MTLPVGWLDDDGGMGFSRGRAVKSGRYTIIEVGSIMRCPKCGYISFDYLESCRKCKKNISEASGELGGTVFEAPSPVFLNPKGADAEAEPLSAEEHELVEDEGGEEAEPMMDLSFEEDALVTEDEIVLDFNDEGEGDGVDLSLVPDEEPTLELDDSEEIALEDEITLDLGGEGSREASEDEGLQLDFSDIDISDLAPPEEFGDEEVAEALTLDEEVLSEGVMSGGRAPSAVSIAPGSGLEDLQVDDLDLDAPAPPVTGSKVGKKLLPSVKTGTALDDFEFDLGELNSDK